MKLAAAALCLIALALFWQGRRGELRRLGAGAAALALGIMAWWLSGASTVLQKRAVIVVLPADEERCAAALRSLAGDEMAAVFGAGGAWEEVGLLRLSGENERGPGRADPWMAGSAFRAELRAAVAGGRTPFAGRAIPRLPVGGGPSPFFVELLKHSLDLFGVSPEAHGLRPTVFFVFDPADPVWKNYAQPAGTDLLKAFNDLQLSRSLGGKLPAPLPDVFVWDMHPEASPGGLHLALPSRIAATGLDAPKFLAHADLPPGWTEPTGQSLELKVDRSVPLKIKGSFFGLEPREVDFRNSAQPPKLPAGFHEVIASLTFHEKGHPKEDTWQTSGFLQTVRHDTVILAKDAGLGDLSRRIWREQTGRAYTYEDFIGSGRSATEKFLRLENSWNLAAFSSPLGKPAKFPTPPQTLILVEPDADSLNALDDYVSQGLANGMGLLVIGPPPPTFAPAKPLPAWLPAHAHAAPAGSGPLAAGAAETVNADWRLYTVFDTSRLALLQPRVDDAVGDSGLPTPATFQRLVAQRLWDKLHVLPGAAAPLVNPFAGASPWVVGGDGFEHRAAPAAGGGQLPVYFQPPLPALPAGSDAPLLLWPRPQLVGPFRTDPAASNYAADISPAREIRPAHLGLRLGACLDEASAGKLHIPAMFLQNPGTAAYRPFSTAERAPNTVFVVFCLDLVQPQQIQSVWAADLSAMPVNPASSAPPPADLIDSRTVLAALTQSKATVVPVVLGMGDLLSAGWQGAGGLSGPLVEPKKLFADLGLTPVVECDLAKATAGTVNAKADKVADDIYKRLAQAVPATLEVKAYGQVIDHRVRTTLRRVPERYRPLELAPGGAVFPINHLVSSTGDILIASADVKRGRVVVLGYSPFAADMWLPDALLDNLSRTLRANNDGRYPDAARVQPYPADLTRWNEGSQDGWGVQRLVDAINLSSPAFPPEGKPRAIRVERRADHLRLTVALPPGVRTPELQCVWNGDPPGAKAPAPLLEMSLLDRTATYQLGLRRSPVPGASPSFLTVSSPGPAGVPDVLTAIYVGDASPQAKLDEEVGQGAALTGATRIPSRGLAASLFAQRRARTPEAVSALSVILAAFLLVYRWPGLRAWWTATRRDARPAVAEESLVPVSVGAALRELGFHPGYPAAIRLPGEPGGRKRYEAGEPLQIAVRSTLFPFSTAARHMGIPAQLPTLRLRARPRSMKVEVWADLHAGLFTGPRERSPLSKGAVIRVLTQVFVQNAWLQAGSVTVRSLQNAAAVYGPAHASESNELAAWLAGEFKTSFPWRPVDPRLLGSLEPGTVLYVVSDFGFPALPWLGSLMDASVQLSLKTRVCRVRDPEEYAAQGSVVSGRGLLLFDRTEWGAEDLRASDDAYGVALREAVASAPDGRYAEVELDQDLLAVLRQLEQERLIG